MQARKTVDDYVTRSRYQGRPVSGTTSRRTNISVDQNSKATNASNDGFLDGLRTGGLASLAAYIFKLSACAPVYLANADVTEPMSPSLSFGGGYALGYGATTGEKAGGFMMYLASLAPEAHFAASTGQYKEAAFMAGTKTLIALSGTGLGALTKRLFRSRTYNTR